MRQNSDGSPKRGRRGARLGAGKKELASELQRRRFKLNMSQAQLVLEADLPVSPQFYGNVERLDVALPEYLVEPLASFFKVRPETVRKWATPIAP